MYSLRQKNNSTSPPNKNNMDKILSRLAPTKLSFFLDRGNNL